jgi:hypothetical protein
MAAPVISQARQNPVRVHSAAFLLLSNQLFRFMAQGVVFMTNQALRRSRRMQDMDPPFAAVNCR